MAPTQRYDVVCYGEVLFDVFPAGAVPGGAPVNVGYHLSRQGKRAGVITKVGIDEDGRKLINFFAGKGLGIDHFQVDDTYATGKVYARPNGVSETVYEFVTPAAWDMIHWEDGLAQIIRTAEFFVYGSLAARSSLSRNTLFTCLEMAENRVLDINLRAPYFNKPTVETLLRKATMLKMNVEELEFITGWFSPLRTVEDRIRCMADRFSIPSIIVTMGGDGAMLYTEGRVIRHDGIRVDVVDTVGCGDAFLAGFLSKLLEKASPEEALEFATRLGAFIALQRGACPEYETIIF